MIISPDGEKQSMWIHQDAWLYLGEFEEGQTIRYTPKNSQNGLFIMVVEGEVELDEYVLSKRDAAGLTEVGEQLELEATAKSKLMLLGSSHAVVKID